MSTVCQMIAAVRTRGIYPKHVGGPTTHRSDFVKDTNLLFKEWRFIKFLPLLRNDYLARYPGPWLNAMVSCRKRLADCVNGCWKVTSRIGHSDFPLFILNSNHLLRLDSLNALYGRNIRISSGNHSVVFVKTQPHRWFLRCKDNQVVSRGKYCRREPIRFRGGSPVRLPEITTCWISISCFPVDIVPPEDFLHFILNCLRCHELAGAALIEPLSNPRRSPRFGQRCLPTREVISQ